jgi:tetratricopeptide (TPR) repeat protein
MHPFDPDFGNEHPNFAARLSPYIMNRPIISLICFSLALLVCACNGTSQQQAQIAALEQRWAAQPTNERSDSLVTLYRDLVKKNLADHATNLKYLTRAAEIQFSRRDNGAPAALWLDDAISNHGKGQDLADAMSLYARIYKSVQYKSSATYSLDNKHIGAMQKHLQGNAQWLDTALVRIDRQMNKGGIVEDKQLAEKFIDICEGYAAITNSEDKYADLLSKAAGLAKTIESFNQALMLYGRLSDRLPEHAKARTALFMQGHIYENDLNNLEKAKAAYELFLQRYPNDPDYADDAKIALAQLGKTPEEIIKGFKN